MAKLVDNAQEQTSGLNEALAALLPYVNAQKANLFLSISPTCCGPWRNLVNSELNVVTSTFESLVYRISKTSALSARDIDVSLGVMVYCARLSLDCNANKNNVLETHMDDLFTRLENTFPANEVDQRIIAMAASWLGRACPVVPHYQTTTSKPQTVFRDQLQSCIPFED